MGKATERKDHNKLKRIKKCFQGGGLRSLNPCRKFLQRVSYFKAQFTSNLKQRLKPIVFGRGAWIWCSVSAAKTRLGPPMCEVTAHLYETKKNH